MDPSAEVTANEVDVIVPVVEVNQARFTLQNTLTQELLQSQQQQRQPKSSWREVQCCECDCDCECDGDCD
jgi:hypothetical protein